MVAPPFLGGVRRIVPTSATLLYRDAPSKSYPSGIPPDLGGSPEAGPAPQKSSSHSTTGSSWSWWKSAPPPSPPNGVADGELDWGWWSISLLVEWATGRVFSTRLQDGKASTGGGWATYLVDRTGLWCFGNYWPVVVWSFLSFLGVGTLIGLAWAVRVLRHYLCCCCWPSGWSSRATGRSRHPCSCGRRCLAFCRSSPGLSRPGVRWT